MFTRLIHIMPPGPPRCFVLRLWLFVCVIVSWAMAYEEADGSCGSYLFRRGKPVAFHAAGGMPESLVGLRMLDDSHVSPASHSIPCSGPHCSQSDRPFSPVEVPPTVRMGDSDQALLSSQIEPGTFLASAHIVPASERGSYFEPNRVFRPPDSR